MRSSNQQPVETRLRSTRLYAGAVGVMAVLLLLVSAAQLYAAPVLITYGREALPKEGDNDYTQVIYLSVPEDSGQRLYLRVFDPEITPANDHIIDDPDTRTTYTLYGGAYAYTAPTARDPLPSPANLAAGKSLLQRDFGVGTAASAWHTLGAFLPAEGELVDQRRVFKLVVSGREGNDGNRYGIAVSLNPLSHTPPPGLRMFTYAPTVRLENRQAVLEMQFDIPRHAKTLEIHNFDAAHGRVALDTPFRSVPIPASLWAEWRSGVVAIREPELGSAAAVTFSGGREMPNDATFYVTDQAGTALPILLPIQEGKRSERPVAVARFAPLSDCVSVAFDASDSQAHGGHTLRYMWDFGDGTQGEGVAPVHVYAEPGAYLVTLTVIETTKAAGNKARQSMRVILSSPPVAAAGPDRTVVPGERVVFDGARSAPGGGKIVEYTWGFGDGTVAKGRRVTRVFNQPGQYLVTLRVTNDTQGRCRHASGQTLVQVNAAPVAEAGPNVMALIGETISLDASLSYDTDGKLQSYVWNLGDGSAAKTGSLIEHVYTQPGRYQISLTVTDDAGVANSVATDTLTVVVTYPPLAQAEADRRAAVGEVIEFDGRTSKAAMGAFADYTWDFGDGAQAKGIQAVYAYKKPGRYRAILTVRDKSSLPPAASSDAFVVWVNEPPLAKAGEDIWSTQSEVHFDGSGSTDADGRIISYHWEFGDGSTSSEPAPVHAYGEPGVYNVRLSVTDDSGTIRNTSTDTLQVTLNAIPIADAGLDQVGEPGQKLFFDAGASVDPDGHRMSFFWNFGDGHTGSGSRVTHHYDQSGIYTVTLNVKDEAGESVQSTYAEAKVTINRAPIAKAGHDILAAPETEVVLSATQSLDPDGEIESYRWTFSDSDAVYGQPEVRRPYATPGLYTARLLVTDDSGAPNNTAQDEVAIHINHPPISVPGSDVKTNQHTIAFDASKSSDPDGHALTYTWDLGDGTPPKSGVKVIHTYATGGTYPVVLTVDDGTGLSNAGHAAAMTVVIDRPPAAVAGTDLTVCTKDNVVFNGSQSSDPEGGPLQYQWAFGDGSVADGVNPTHKYTAQGVYPVMLTVRDDSGFPENRHTDGLTVTVKEAPIAIAGPDQSACVHAPVFFDGSASQEPDGEVNRYIWDFGDNSPLREGASLSHRFAKPGTYRVLLSIVGDAVEMCGGSDADELLVTVKDGPRADFTAPDMASEAEPVHFDASGSTSSQAPIVSWQWDFGDGTSGEGEKVTHTYTQPGAYTVRLKVATQDNLQGCQVAAAQKQVKVNTRPQAVATTPNPIVGIHQEVLLDASNTRDGDSGIATYTWDLGDGTTATGMQVRHRYTTSGTFPVVLTVADNTALKANTDTAALEITVNSPPQPRILAPERTCAGVAVTFRGGESYDLDGEITRYEWDFGDGQTGQGATVSHVYERPGRYQATLVVDDDRSVSNSRNADTMTILVNQPPRAEIRLPQRVVCPAEAVSFDGSASMDADGQLIRYQWDFGDGQSAEGAMAANTFAKPGRYPVRLTVTDDSGGQCAQAEQEVIVTVNARPLARAGDDQIVQIGGAYDAVLFDATQSSDPDGDPLTYEWTVEQDTIESGAKVMYAYKHSGQYRVRLRVRDGSGLDCGEAWDEVVIETKVRE